MRDAINSIRHYTKGMAKNDFMKNPITMDATILQIQIIGEASRHLSPILREHAKDIPWRKIIGMRNVLIHDYSNRDEHVIWDAVQNHLPDLRRWVLQQLRERGRLRKT